MINLKFAVEPLRLTLAERQNFKVSIAATNQGDEVINPELYTARLFINGSESMVWSLAILNGPREEKWLALPPGETVSMTWPSMGESLFPDPGSFVLVLRFSDLELAPIQVQVLAE